jgi:hypothetical protein
MKSFYIIFGFVFLTFAANAFAADEFITGFEDIPLMEGLYEQPDGLTGFDSPDGRFIQVILKADDSVTRESVRAFYKENLSSLGWQTGKNDCYEREDEQLCLKIWDSQPVFTSIELRSVTK